MDSSNPASGERPGQAAATCHAVNGKLSPLGVFREWQSSIAKSAIQNWKRRTVFRPPGPAGTDPGRFIALYQALAEAWACCYCPSAASSIPRLHVAIIYPMLLCLIDPRFLRLALVSVKRILRG